MEAKLLEQSKAIATGDDDRDKVQATISSLCSYAEYMIGARAGSRDVMMELLEEAMRLSVRKGRSSDELLPAYQSCFCLYAQQVRRSTCWPSARGGSAGHGC